MSMTVSEVEKALLALALDDRVAVVQRGLQSIESEDSEQREIDASWREELSRRIDDIENGRVKMLDGDRAHAMVRAALTEMRQ